MSAVNFDAILLQAAVLKASVVFKDFSVCFVLILHKRKPVTHCYQLLSVFLAK